MRNVVIIVLIIISYIFIGSYMEKKVIPDDAIRFRILANSNSIEDQRIKMDVAKTVQKELYDLLKDVSNVKDARNIIVSNLDTIKEQVENTLQNMYDIFVVFYDNIIVMPNKRTDALLKVLHHLYASSDNIELNIEKKGINALKNAESPLLNPKTSLIMVGVQVETPPLTACDINEKNASSAKARTPSLPA